MEEKEKNGLIIALIIFVVLLTALGGYLVYDKVINKKENTEEKAKKENAKKQKENKEKEETAKLKNYDINSIKNIEVRVPELGVSDPEVTSVIIDNKEEIKEILLNVDKKEEVGKVPYGIGFTSNNVTITINHEGDPSTNIIILNNGNVAINPAVGAAESGYAEYKIENKNLATELTNKYQKKE